MSITISYTTICVIIITLCVLKISLNINWIKFRSVLINGALIIMGAICEAKLIMGSDYNWKITLINIVVLSSLFGVLYIDCLRRLRKLERARRQLLIEENIRIENKFIASAIEDFKAGKYCITKVESERVYLKIDKEEGLWKLTYKNYITKEEFNYCEDDNNKAKEDK